jgi:type II secretory pathway pseudopilin PulG
MMRFANQPDADRWTAPMVQGALKKGGRRKPTASRRSGSAPRGAVSGRASARAFTLVEIILAIGLATALLLIALTFYQQAAETRLRILRESEKVSTMRLVFDRLAGDLRSAQPKAVVGHEFTGDSTSMSFIKEAYASFPPGSTPVAGDPTDLVRICLTTLTTTNGTRVEVSGLDRVETPANLAPTNLTPDTNATLTLGTNSSLFSVSNAAPLSVYPPDQTNLVAEPFADIVRFVRFRYWDGAVWQAGWTNVMPPPGVEIVLSSERLPEDAEQDAYPPEASRRVVFVPGGMPNPGSDAGGSTNSLASP